MTEYRYFKVSPRGFSNEFRIYRVKPEQVAEVEATYEGFEDDVERGGFAIWTTDKAASRPGVAIDWADREF